MKGDGAVFHNVGDKIRVSAYVILIVGCVSSLISAIAVWATVGTFWQFCTISVGGAVITMIISWIVYGLGTLVINSDMTVTLLNRLYAKTQENVPASQAASRPAEFRAPERAAAATAAQDTAASPANTVVQNGLTPIPTSDGAVICPKCRTKQNAGRSVCWNCGAHFS